MKEKKFLKSVNGSPNIDFVVWPPLSSISSDEAMQCLAIVSWFAGPIARSILIPVRDIKNRQGTVPNYVSLSSLFDRDKVSFVSIDESKQCIEQGNVTLLLRSRNVGNDLLLVNAKQMTGSIKIDGYFQQSKPTTVQYYYLGTPEEDIQDAYYATCLTYWATGGEDQQYLAMSRDKLQEIKELANLYEGVSIFGTGPSLTETLGYDHSRSLNIICNTIVKNRSFLSEIRPKIIVAADAHFHFSYHRYSARLLSDIAYSLDHSDAVFFTFDKFAAFLRCRVPSIADRVFGIPAGRIKYGYDLDRDFRLYPGDSVLNMFLLPLACFLSDNVLLHGFTGRAPTDSYFWSHSELHQYTDLLSCVRLAHPAFFRNRDYTGYADNVDNEIAMRVDYARSAGKTLISETTSFYSSFAK